jgi:signal transduction histidine kinase
MPTLYGRLSETAAGLLGARRVIFWRLEGGLLKGQAQAYGVEPDLLAQMVAAVSPDGDDLADRIVFRDELFNATIDASEEFEPYRHLLDALGARDAIAVPWKAGEQRLGLVAVYDSLKPGGFTRDDVVVLRIAALAAALVWEHRRAEDALAEAKDQEAAELRVAATRSAELERIKGEFLKLASHELRGPLSVIGGYLSMIEDGSLGPLSSELIPVVPILGSKVREMTLLVDQMLETARLEDQKLALQIRTFDLRDVVTSTIEAMRILIPPTHRLDVVLPRRALLVEGDASRLGTVLSNLIDNAVRYSPDGGTVEVRCTVRQSARQVMIEVTDQGLGISADDIPRLFVRFGRIVTADNSHISGTGLGLYLSQEIVRRHGGEISVRSQLHKGSTFSVTLPLAAPVRRRTEARTAPVGRRPQDPAGRR